MNSHFLSIHIWIHVLIRMWIRVWIHKICFHTWIRKWINIWEYKLCVWIHMQTLLGTPKFICFLLRHDLIMNAYEFIYEFMIFQWIHIWIDGMYSRANPSWLPKFMDFHGFMQDIMDFGLISWEGSYSKSCLTNIVKNIMKNIVTSWNFKREFSIEFIGAVHGRAVSDRASPSCRCCSTAICPTICWSVFQSNSANTCHLVLIIHSVLVARVAQTWIL